ncbi:TetR/AcrR family transcriptional regulator [Streptomyces sp. N50]|uniref:TetR/AcrR family transcriptional regulator n=1 Tax=Streptomyces sp. N50 TaxID=3081765 RepID=UPI00296251DE|nr:TetR family transcriptional regulator [Streptomyces sp. N50]WOX16264.1 TetR family transcriptional regulator [Streptomyces sp. N50]
MTVSKPRRSPKPPERQRDPERTRKLILDAAVAEFAAHGYAGARIAAIAKRAGVNQQLISYYFDGKEGLFRAMSDSWGERASKLVEPGTPLSEQLRRYVMEALENRDGMRLLAWGGLEYTGPEADPDQGPRTERLAESVADIRERQAAGALPREMDPACLTVMLMAAAMAPVTLPHVIAGVCGDDPQSPEFIERFADQLALLVRRLGLDSDGPV